MFTLYIAIPGTLTDGQTDRQICYINKCIGDDTKAAARQNLNCIKNTLQSAATW